MGVLRTCLAVFMVLAAASQASAKELVVDLSKSVVAITTSFSGSELLLFGATEGKGDVIVVVRGPLRNEIIRRKEKIAGIWVNQEEMVFEQVPSFYAVASNRPMDEFLSSKIRSTYQIGIDYLDLNLSEEYRAASGAENFRRALIRNKQKQGLYGRKPGDVIFLGNRLFRSQLIFPANVAVGSYGVDVFLVRDGAVTSVETTLLTVRKFGFEASVFNFAHRNSLAYGIFAVLIAAFAGWLAGAIFRKA